MCGKECRRLRQNKLARRRRRGERGERCAEEAARQRAHRQAKRGACHAPPSDDKYLELLLKLEQIVDDGARLSRATFRREVRRIFRQNGLFGAADMDGAGRCHTPPSVLGPAEMGSGSVVRVDGVTRLVRAGCDGLRDVSATAHAERRVALAELGERLGTLRLADAAALAAMRSSLAHHGQLSPVRAFEHDGRLEVFDGFKRLRVARGLGLGELSARVVDVDVVEATVHMRELQAGRGHPAGGRLDGACALPRLPLEPRRHCRTPSLP